MDLGFQFIWYVSGPYSLDLLDYVYDRYDVLATLDYEEHKLLDDIQHKVDIINGLYYQEHISIYDWYKIIASIQFNSSIKINFCGTYRMIKKA